MPTGRSPGEEDLLRVPAVLVCMLVHPGDRSLDVDDLVGEGRVRAQPVVGLHAEPASAREVVHDRQPLLILLPVGPRAPVEVDQHGTVLRARPANVEIELVPDAGVPVRHVGDVLDVAPARPERSEGLAERRDRSSHRPARDRDRRSCSKSSPSRGPQRSPDRRLGGATAAHETRSPTIAAANSTIAAMPSAESSGPNTRTRPRSTAFITSAAPGTSHGNEPDHPAEPTQRRADVGA